jgi:hypothetical protein
MAASGAIATPCVRRVTELIRDRITGEDRGTMTYTQVVP